MAADNHDLTIIDSRPSRADAVKNRELLLETARDLFAEQGVDAVSMTQIAQEAKVGKGTLYRHFSNKTELCHALLDQEMRDIQEATLRRLRQHPNPEETLRWFLKTVLYFVDRNITLLNTEMDSGASALEFPAHLWWRQTVRGLLGRLEIIGDLEYITDVFYVMLDAQTIQFQRQNYDLERILEGLNDTLNRYLQ